MKYMSQALPTVAIVGQANVGKSSLFNRLYGAQEAIVAREAGTTRDNVIRRITLPLEGGRKEEGRSQTTSKRVTARGADPHFFAGSDAKNVGADALAGPAQSDLRARQQSGNDGSGHIRSFWLVDTAGLKKADDDFEASIQEQIEEAADVADVILVVVDGSQYPSDLDRTVAKKALRSKKPVVLVINKTDLRNALPDDEFRRLGISTIIRTSAEHARGIQKLTDAIVQLLPTPNSGLRTPDQNDPLRIALVGRPNVGKSHLFNTLAGKQQAIVANIAGTTRDVNRISLRYHDTDIEILDTAGVRKSGKQEVGIEKFSVLRTIQAIEESDICCLLMDVSEYNTALDQKLAGIIKEAGKGLIIVVTKWDLLGEGDEDAGDRIARHVTQTFDFVPWAPLLFTSSITGRNATKIFELSMQIHDRRQQQIKTTELNRILQRCVHAHPPAGLKNTYPKLRYMVQTDTAPPWFVIFGGNLKLLHWSYKRYLERQLREEFDFTGTPIMFSFRQEAKKES